MAGSTTNIGLIKPTYSEDADVAIINENMDTLDSTISALDNGLAIVSNNNTHGAITAGQYVYVRNHGSLAEGMYTANSNIAANATLSSSNLTAVSSGSLNKLNSDLAALNSNLGTWGYASDADTDTRRIFPYDNSTLHTPLKQGVSWCGNGMIINNDGASYACQIAMPSGTESGNTPAAFIRGRAANGWTAWERVATSVKTAITATAGDNVVIDINRSYLCGDIAVIAITGHMTAASQSANLFTLDLPANMLQYESVFALTIGPSQWQVTKIGYAYLNPKAIVSSNNNILSGEYFHVYFTAILNR